MTISRTSTLTARGLVVALLLTGAAACGGGDEAATAKLAAQTAADEAAAKKIQAQADADKAAAERAAAEKAAADKAAAAKEAAAKAAADKAAAVVPAAAADTSAAADTVNFVLPSFRGQNLQVSQDKIQTLGVFFSVSHDLIASRMQVVDSNWQVCNQTPAAGTRITGAAADWEGKIDLGVVKLTETCP